MESIDNNKFCDFIKSTLAIFVRSVATYDDFIDKDKDIDIKNMDFSLISPLMLQILKYIYQSGQMRDILIIQNIVFFDILFDYHITMSLLQMIQCIRCNVSQIDRCPISAVVDRFIRNRQFAFVENIIPFIIDGQYFSTIYSNYSIIEHSNNIY